MLHMFQTKKKSENQIDLESLTFIFTHKYIGSAIFEEATFDSYSLATLMFDRPRNILDQIRFGMKIISGAQLKDMDDETFDALIAYGNELCSSPALKM